MEPEQAPEPETDAWAAALDLLEADIQRAEMLLTSRELSAHEPWAPPIVEPMPAVYAERARQLLDRQQRVLAQIPTTMAALRRQQAVTARIGQATGTRTSAPVFIDASA